MCSQGFAMKSLASSLPPTFVLDPSQLQLVARRPSHSKWGSGLLILSECFRNVSAVKIFGHFGVQLSCSDITRLTEPQTWDVDNLGVRIFAFHENALATMRSVLDTALLFAPLHTKGRTSAAGLRWGSNVKSPAMILLTLFDSEAYLTYIGSNSFWCERVKSSSLLTLRLLYLWKGAGNARLWLLKHLKL